VRRTELDACSRMTLLLDGWQQLPPRTGHEHLGWIRSDWVDSEDVESVATREFAHLRRGQRALARGTLSVSQSVNYTGGSILTLVHEDVFYRIATLHGCVRSIVSVVRKYLGLDPTGRRRTQHSADAFAGKTWRRFCR
jgi:hypothetical protein